MSDDLSPEEQAIYDAELAVAEKLADDAMAPYLQRLPAPELELMRETIVEVLMTHPNATELIAALAKRAAGDVSGDVGPGVATDAEGADRSGKA